MPKLFLMLFLKKIYKDTPGSCEFLIEDDDDIRERAREYIINNIFAI